MLYYYYNQVDFGTEMARKAILETGELVSCFHAPSSQHIDADPQICLAPHNALLPGFSIKAFARLAREQLPYRRVPLADLDTAEVRIGDTGALRVRLPLPGAEARVWRYDESFSKRIEVETRNEIVLSNDSTHVRPATGRTIAEFEVVEDFFGYAAFSVEYEDWHRQFAFQWHPRSGKGAMPAPRVLRRAAALALLDGDIATARINAEVRVFLQSALLVLVESWLGGASGGSASDAEILDQLSSPDVRLYLEDLLQFKLPEVRTGEHGSRESNLIAYKHDCLLTLGKNLPVVESQGELGLASLVGSVLDGVGLPEAVGLAAVRNDRIALALDDFWQKLTG